jgi:hypothetical protein
LPRFSLNGRFSPHPHKRPRAGREPALVFAPVEEQPPGLELLVNFGVFSGREVTPAEIDGLAHDLLARFPYVSVVSERRYEVGSEAEGAVHQVRIQIGREFVPMDEHEQAELRGRLLEVTERWANACIADRHDELSEGLGEPVRPR